LPGKHKLLKKELITVTSGKESDVQNLFSGFKNVMVLYCSRFRGNT
jgi:hypothetical protein